MKDSETTVRTRPGKRLDRRDISAFDLRRVGTHRGVVQIASRSRTHASVSSAEPRKQENLPPARSELPAVGDLMDSGSHSTGDRAPRTRSETSCLDRYRAYLGDAGASPLSAQVLTRTSLAFLVAT